MNTAATQLPITFQETDRIAYETEQGIKYSPVMEVGAVYTLDGLLYRCLEQQDCGLCWFQRLNEDGTDYCKVFYDASGCVSRVFNGKHTIWNRLTEMKLVPQP